LNAERLAAARAAAGEIEESAAAFRLAIAEALQPLIPRGFRARVQMVIDNGVIKGDTITLELRPSQGTARM
jgi:hypothetical protein